MIDDYDANFLSYIARLYEALNGEKLDFTDIKSAVDALAKFNEKQEYNYLNNLLYPEKCKGVKIPSPVPVPSCSFQLHNSTTISTNNRGNLALIFNPFFLANRTTPFNNGAGDDYVWQNGTNKYWVDYFTSMAINNDDTLTGYEPNERWKPLDIFQSIPDVYSQYRLVSASIVVKYIGRLDIVSGVIGGAIVFDESPEMIAAGHMTINDVPNIWTAIPSNLEKYGNFDLAMDSFYHQENLCIEGMRQLYFPIDNSYEEYIKLTNDSLVTVEVDNDSREPKMKIDGNNFKNGFKYMIYTLGAPPDKVSFKVDIYCNFECLPNAEFLNYLPLSINVDSTTQEQKKEATLIIQQKPIMKINETETRTPGNQPSIWRKMYDKFKSSLPSIGKLVAQGLISAIPGYKPGLALAGTILNSALSSGNTPMTLG
ncbi:MAG: hypothetical protein J6O41_06825 [Clostridia bacterium]|nr:hypothetical protein [Clostridia bacterium]